MKEQRAVLDFFSKPENLPLGLSVAEQMDEIRSQLNTRYWQALKLRLDAMVAGTHWQSRLTEDRNSDGVVVGLQLMQPDVQTNNLFPMMEQQYLGGAWRIFYGLMWQKPPSSAQSKLPAVQALNIAFTEAGYKSNESFLAWQWTHHYPRRSDFLLQFTQRPEALIEASAAIFSRVLHDQQSLLTQANFQLSEETPTLKISLDHLRRNVKTHKSESQSVAPNPPADKQVSGDKPSALTPGYSHQKTDVPG